MQINLIKGKKKEKEVARRSQFSETLKFLKWKYSKDARRALNQMKEAWTYKNCVRKAKAPSELRLDEKNVRDNKEAFTVVFRT